MEKAIAIARMKWEVERAAESMNRISSALTLHKEMITREISNTIGRIQDDIRYLDGILPEVGITVGKMRP